MSWAGSRLPPNQNAAQCKEKTSLVHSSHSILRFAQNSPDHSPTCLINLSSRLRAATGPFPAPACVAARGCGSTCTHERTAQQSYDNATPAPSPSFNTPTARRGAAGRGPWAPSACLPSWPLALVLPCSRAPSSSVCLCMLHWTLIASQPSSRGTVPCRQHIDLRGAACPAGQAVLTWACIGGMWLGFGTKLCGRGAPPSSRPAPVHDESAFRERERLPLLLWLPCEVLGNFAIGICVMHCLVYAASCQQAPSTHSWQVTRLHAPMQVTRPTATNFSFPADPPPPDSKHRAPCCPILPQTSIKITRGRERPVPAGSTCCRLQIKALRRHAGMVPSTPMLTNVQQQAHSAGAGTPPTLQPIPTRAPRVERATNTALPRSQCFHAPRGGGATVPTTSASRHPRS